MLWRARERQEHVDAVAAEIEALGRRTLRVMCDVLDRASIQRLHDAVIAAFGKVDILVNAAGMTKKVPTLDEDEAEWLKIIDTNLTGTMRACQIFGRTMVNAHYGRIINIASSTAFRGFVPAGGLWRQQERGGLADQDAGD